jgi:hypothetical protein
MPPIPKRPVPFKGIDFRKATMLRVNTPVENHLAAYGLWVKREDLACPPPGPPFSKTRGVYARVASRPEKVIGVLDTYHSQAGWAVARACQILGKQCLNFYPLYKGQDNKREPQGRSQMLGAELRGLPAGRSCILFHQARKVTEAAGGYMMPNALKLEESVAETAKETVGCVKPPMVLIPVSSGTIAAGVVRGFGLDVWYLLHLGYSRSHDEVLRYVEETSGVTGVSSRITLIDEGYAYKDKSKPGPTPPWPCNEYYDLKAFRWWMATGRRMYDQQTLLWNIG